MTTSRMEELLERIVEQNDEAIALLTAIDEKVGASSDSVKEIAGELNWTNDLSLGKQLMDGISSLETTVSLKD